MNLPAPSDNARVASALARLNSPAYAVIARAFHCLVNEAHSYLSSVGALAVAAPVILDSISSPMGLGSDSMPVALHMNGRDTFLCDSAQFSLELAVRTLDQPAYYVMHSFRGEHSDARHLAEFIHVEFENIGAFDETRRLAEDLVRRMVIAIGKAIGMLPMASDHAAAMQEALMHAERPDPWPVVSHREAARLIYGEQSEQAGTSRVLQAADELLLTEMFGGPVWLVHLPHSAVPFYQAFASRRTDALAGDLLVPRMGEVLGLGQRHASPEDLYAALQLHGVDPEPYDWYLNLRKRKLLHTSGFGLGTERLTAWILGLDHIAQVPLLPRLNAGG